MFDKSESDSELFKIAQKIYSYALEAVSPEKLIQENVLVKQGALFVSGEKFDLSKFQSVYMVAFGKAAPKMAEAMLKVMGSRIKGGIFLSQQDLKKKIPPLVCLKASHPYPDLMSVRAAKEILAFVEKMDESDLLITLISGGGSSQLCLPPLRISWDEKAKTVKNLILAGADIKELNAVRKHISQVKGGRLAKSAYPASVVSLIISDVIGNDLETIASGPTYWDSSTYHDAIEILKKYHLWRDSPKSIKRFLERGREGKETESIKKGEPYLEKAHNFILGDNKTALEAAAQKASQMGLKVSVFSSSEQGEARERAEDYLSLMLRIKERAKPNSQPECLISGGELTVSVKGKGKGGPNQEFVLAFIQKARNWGIKEGGWIIVSQGTDGIDGPTDAAGAWASREVLKRMIELNLEPELYLKNNDSYNFFKKLGTLIKTGPTQTNVMDLRVLIGGYK